MATIFASTTGSGTVTYAQAQTRSTPATLARALALHLAGDRIECELGTYGAIGSGLLGGADSSHKTTLATVDLGAGGKAKFQVADGSAPVFVPTHSNIALENVELTHGDAATRSTVGSNLIETNSSVAAQNVDFLGCKLGNTRNNVIFSSYGPLPTPANQIQIDRSAPIATANAQLVSFDPPQSYLKGGSAGAAASVTTAASLVGALFKGGHAVHQTETTFNIQPTNPSSGTFSYVTWGGTSNRAWFADLNANTFGVATSINKGRAAGSGTDITLVVFGCETWKNGKTNATLPNPTNFQNHANAAVDLILTAATNNGGAAYFTHVSTWQEYKGRVNLAGPPTGWSKTGLPTTAPTGTSTWGTAPYFDAVVGTSVTTVFSNWYVPGRKTGNITGAQQHSTPIPGFASAPHVAVTTTNGYLSAIDPRTIKANGSFRQKLGTASPLYGQATAITTGLGMTAAQVTDAVRELSRDAAGNVRSTTASLTTVGALEENTQAGTATPWSPTQWNASSAFTRTRYVSPTATGTDDGSSPTHVSGTIGPWTFTQAKNGCLPGDDIIIQDGTYPTPGGTNAWFIQRGGIATAPIRFRAQNPLGAKFTPTTGYTGDIFQLNDDSTAALAASPLVGVVTDPASMGITSGRLTDIQRELGTDSMGRPRAAAISQRSIGAVEALPAAGTGAVWQPTQWNPSGTFVRTRYVSATATGLDDGSNPTHTTGTIGPWTFAQARSNLAPGDDIIVLDGTYPTPVGNAWYIQRGGTAAHPVRIRAQNLHGAILTPGSGWTGSVLQLNDDAGAANPPDYIIFDGLQIDGLSYQAGIGIQPRWTGGAGGQGRTHVAIVNCYVHHCSADGIATEQGRYWRVDSNLIYSVGVGRVNESSGISINRRGVDWIDDGATGIVSYCCRNWVVVTRDDDPPGAQTDGNGIIMDSGSTSPQINWEPTLVSDNVTYGAGGRGQHVLAAKGGPIYVMHGTCYNNDLESTTNANQAGAGAEFNTQNCPSGAVVWANNYAQPTTGTAPTGSQAYHFEVSGSGVQPTIFSCYYGPGGITSNVTSSELHSIADPLFVAAPALVAPASAVPTLTDPKTLRAANNFQPQYVLQHPDYVIFDGLELDGLSTQAGTGFHLRATGTTILRSHVAILNCYIHHLHGAAISTEETDYCRFDSNYIFDCGVNSTSTGHPSAILLTQNSVSYTSDGYTGFHHYIVNNWIAGTVDGGATTGSVTDGNAIVLSSGSTSTTFTMAPALVANNVIYHNGNRGIQLIRLASTGTAGAGVFVGYNTLHENGLDTRSNNAVAGSSSEFSNQGSVACLFNNFANPWQGTGSFGSYIWEVDPTFNPDATHYVPDSSTAGGATGAASDTNYDQYYAWAVTKFYNVLYDTIKNHANPIVNQLKVGGPHLGFGGLNGSSGTTGFVTGGEALHAWPMGSPDYDFTTNTGTSLPYEIDYFLLTYWMRFAHGFDFITLDYSLVEFSDTPNRTTSYIMSHYTNMGNLIRKVAFMRDTYPGLDANTWDSAHPNTPPKRSAQIHMIEFYFDVNIGLCDANYTESVQAMQEALVLRELWMNGVTKGYRWMPMGDVDNPSAPTSYVNTYAYFRNTGAVGIGNSTGTDVTSTGAGTKYKAYDVAKLFSDNFTTGTSLYKATTADPDLVCMASGSKLLVINTNLTTAKTFTVEGVSKTLSAKDVAVYPLTGTTLDDAGWRFLGCDIYRGNQNNIVAHGSNWEIGNWTNGQSVNVRGQVHWWGDSTVRSGSTHGIVDFSRNMKIHDTDFHNDEAVVLDTGRAISQRASGLEVYNCTFHDCPPWKLSWYDNMHGVTRFHDNKGWNLWDVFTTFVGASDVAPNLYTWTAGQNAVDDITIAKNTFHFTDTTTNTSAAGNVFDFTDASAAYIGNLEIADNVVTGNFSKGWDFGTRTAAFLTNQGNLGSTISLTNTFHSHNNIYRITSGTGVQFRHQNTTRSLAATQSAGALSGFAQETGTQDIDPNLGLAPGSGSTLITSTFGAPDFYPQSPTGPTVDSGTNTLDDLGLTGAPSAASGHFRTLGTLADIGYAEYVSSTTPSWVQGTVGSSTSATATTATTGTLVQPPTPGNILTLAIYYQAGGTLATPAGWSAVASAADSTSAKTAVFQKLAGSSEPTSITVTVPAASSIVVIYDEWTGVSTASPIDTAADGTAATAGTGTTAVAVTGAGNPTQTGDIGLTFLGWQSVQALTLGAGSTGTTWTIREGPTVSTGSTGTNVASMALAMSQGPLSTSSAQSFAGTLANARRWAAVTIALRAAALTSPPSNTVLPVITPTTGITAGSTLTTTNGTWTNAPTSFAYQWTKNGTNIAGATSSTYTVLTTDAGSSIAAVVTATNSIGSVSATANAVTIPGVPANSVAPGISGATSQGSTLTATTGSWTNSPTGFTYQWRRDAVDISGATAPTYSIVGLDLGHSITARITATNSFGSNSATSNSIAIPSSAYGQGPAVVGLEILEWPATLPVAAVPTTAWSDFVPVLYPLSPEGIPTFLATQMRTVFASPAGGTQAAMAIYSYGYASANTFGATLVATTAAFSAPGTSPRLIDLIGAPIGLDFTQNRYFVGIMTQGGPKVLHSLPGASLFSVVQFVTPRANLTDWPATFSQTDVQPYSSGWPYIALGTAASTWFI
jgi:hypothetical protein